MKTKTRAELWGENKELKEQNKLLKHQLTILINKNSYLTKNK